MATTKKTTAKKTTTKRKAPAKKSVKAPKEVKMESFKLSANQPPFLSVRITRQTVYWSILLIFILITQLWILNIQMDVIDTLESLNSL